MHHLSELRTIQALGVVLVATLSGMPAHAERFVIDGDGESALVEFESRALMESFTGRTRAVVGFVECTPAALGDSITVYVEVDMASLDTGIGKRNSDMRDNHLETDRYPTATFRGASLHAGSPRSLPAGRPTDVSLSGMFTLHGISRRIDVTVTLTADTDASGATLHAVTTFPVRLEDHEIARPKFLFLKLGEVQQVNVDVLARESREGDPRPVDAIER